MLVPPEWRLKLVEKIVEIIEKVPWRTVAKEAGKYVAGEVGKKLVNDLLEDKDLTFQEKLDALEQMKREGKISEEEYKVARQSLVQSFPSHKV